MVGPRCSYRVVSRAHTPCSLRTPVLQKVAKGGSRFSLGQWFKRAHRLRDPEGWILGDGRSTCCRARRGRLLEIMLGSVDSPGGGR